ncbi:MAG: carbohydrate-binding protein, partial [Burkholderiales bacterium]|nr:carbohydrate-binding protein [Phycisphaerae bacterium]
LSAFDEVTVVVTAGPVQTQTPFSGTPFAVGATIQAEQFDNGGTGVAFFDSDSTNNGGKYRTDTGVDIENTTDSGGGFNVAYAVAGEWLEYTINVVTAGNYVLSSRVAHASNGGTFHVEFNGTNKTGAIAIPNTGGWQNWQTVTRTVNLQAGIQVMRVAMDTNGVFGFTGNFNWFKLTTA